MNTGDMIRRVVGAGLYAGIATFAAPTYAGLPAPVDEQAMAPWAFPWSAEVPGVMSAASLIDKPAGKDGPVVARDGHFFAGSKRIRFVGVNIAFGGNFPEHEQADAIAGRLAAFGVNIVRFHHMDNQPYPNGIFADREFEKLSDQALDRLDYFIAALKKQGVYTDLNLHVSRDWARAQKWANAELLPGYDKQVDIFHPDLIAANCRYAKDLLTHVNAYTQLPYTDEPAVAMVEINNEDTIFLWGGEQNLAKLPEPYAGMLQTQWNEWLVKTWGSKDKLAEAWNKGAEPIGDNVIGDGTGATTWGTEQHEPAKMTVEKFNAATRLNVTAVDGTDWHLQFNHAGIKLAKGKFYTLDFTAKANKLRKLNVSTGMAHAPWGNLGLACSIDVTAEEKHYRLGFTVTNDDDNARISFALGASLGSLTIGEITLRQGGREGLRAIEDPGAGTVARGGLGGAETTARTSDWYRFLQAIDQAYFDGMRNFLKNQLGVKAPITGTIGLGILGTMSQDRMDFVDAHAYWDHPHFPRRQWDMKDWEIKNQPMVDNPAGATLWGLAATRIWKKPFTVTEYNHAAPNEWQAECVPMIFAYAALQDWDAVFLFDYVASTKYQKQNTENFFSIEGNVAKMAALPLAARLFLGGQVAPSKGELIIQPTPGDLWDNASAYFYQQWPFLRDVKEVTWQQALDKRLSVWFVWKPLGAQQEPSNGRIAWTASSSGTGQFVLKDASGSVFVGFSRDGKSIDLGIATITSLQTPFAAIQLLPADSSKTLADAGTLLLSAVARTTNTGMKWDEKHSSVSNQWGTGPARIEVVHADIELAASKPVEVWALGPDGKRGNRLSCKFDKGRATFSIGSEDTVWYEIVK